MSRDSSAIAVRRRELRATLKQLRANAQAAALSPQYDGKRGRSHVASSTAETTSSGTRSMAES